ncbi:hypothetical protein ACHWQZ_G006197 [Mnemiopsis leidyi]
MPHNSVYVLKCCFAMVPVFRSEDQTYPRPAHLPIKTHSSRSARSSRSPHSPNSLNRMTVCAEEVSKFCEFHSRHAAYHLAHNVHLFMRDHSLPPPVTQGHFMDKFLEGFRTHFESGYRLAQTGASEELKCTDDTCCKSDIKSSKLKQIKDLVFGKTQWSDVNGQALCSSNIIRVGSVSLLTEKANEFCWKKIWLLLTHTEAGNMLYIYTNKSEHPTKAVKCCQLKEVRPTRTIEENSTLSKIAFVIKIQQAEEYILHAQSKHQRNDWVRQIRSLIPTEAVEMDDLSDSDGEEDGRSNTGFSSASTGSHSTSTSDSLETAFETHMEINEFRAVSEHELLSERRIPKPNSYSSLPQSNQKDHSWHRRFRPFQRGGAREGDTAPHQSLSLPSSRPGSRHSRSSSPDCITKQRSNSLRHDSREARNHVFMPTSNSLPGRDHSVELTRHTSHGSDGSLPSGTGSQHNSLNRVYSAPATAPSNDPPGHVRPPAETVITPPQPAEEETPSTTYSQYQPQVRHTMPRNTPGNPPRITRVVPRLPTTYSTHTYSNIPPSPTTTACSTPSTITPSTSVSEDWTEHGKQERHAVPPLKKDSLVVHSKLDTMGTLLTMPWFHSQISRTEAASHVTMGGSDTHGRFLIRKSDTKQGELVLTFNNEGGAKHLRMKVTETGCQIQHLSFGSVEEMIEHFKRNPIQLDNTTLDTSCHEVYLTDFIPSDLQDEGTPVPSVSTSFFPQNVPERGVTSSPSERPPSLSPIDRGVLSPVDRPRSRTPPARPPRNDQRVYKGASSRV